MGSTPTWSPPQQSRLAEWGIERSVDVHCHCLPSLDDGPATIEESLQLCRRLIADGITTVVATPHQLGSYDRLNTSNVIRAAVGELQAKLAEEEIALEILPGADVRVDERLQRLLDADQVMTVADAGRHLLLELPHEVFVDPLSSIEALVARGVQPIMTHPERHRYLANSVSRIRDWTAAGAVLQITAGSVLGEFGQLARQEGWRLVHAGIVSLVATDAHNAARRPPRLTAAIEAIADELGADAARTLCLQNPLRVSRGERLDPTPVA